MNSSSVLWNDAPLDSTPNTSSDMLHQPPAQSIAIANSMRCLESTTSSPQDMYLSPSSSTVSGHISPSDFKPPSHSEIVHQPLDHSLHLLPTFPTAHSHPLVIDRSASTLLDTVYTCESPLTPLSEDADVVPVWKHDVSTASLPNLPQRSQPM